jgi:hypothetical protein
MTNKINMLGSRLPLGSACCVVAAASLCAPPIAYAQPIMGQGQAIRGLNIWTTGGQYARTGIVTVNDGTKNLMWPGNGAAYYSFTVATNGFPSPATPGYMNFTAFMYLVPVSSDDTVLTPDWDYPNCIWMELAMVPDVPGWAYWTFRWKTNSVNANGQFYSPNNQVMMTDSTPVGKWTLILNNNNSSNATVVSMSGPTQSTNFTMGYTKDANGNVLVPELGSSFSAPGQVNFGNYITDANADGDELVLSAAAVYGTAITTVSNNWVAENAQTLDLNKWALMGDPPPIALVPTNNCYWITWTVPDDGYGLQTNSANIGNYSDWSTNHGLTLPTNTILGLKRLLVKPGDLPPSQCLFFRLASPPY